MKDLDVALGKFRVVFKRAGNDVIVTASYKLTERSPLNDQVNIEGFGAIALRYRDPVSFTMKGYLHNLGYSDALDQLRAGYDEVIFRATREGSKSFERTIRDSPTPSGGPPGS